MRKVIQGEERFQIDATEFSASPSREETVLMYSSDGINYTAWGKKVPARETTVVNNFTNGMFFYFKGNKTNLEINWED